MGNSACCQDSHVNRVQIPQLTIQKPVLATIQKFMQAHPAISEVLQQNGNVQIKFRSSKKSELKNCKQFILKDGTFISDSLVNDKKNGYGAMLYSNGHYYEGQWKDNLKQGLGILISDEGSYYYGEWIDDLAHGRGVHQTKNPRNVYTGEWASGVKNGQGVQHYEDGSTYTGSFINGTKSGKGKLIYGNGTEYQGQFKQNVIEGAGVFKGKKHIYEGEWKAGKMHGTGRSEWRNEANEVIAKYVGQYRDGIKEGFGEYTDSKGVIYKAMWIDGQINEKGPILTQNLSRSSSY